MFFPAVAVLNKYLLGDTVLVEPIADELAINGCAYVVSNYAELFESHPRIVGVRAFTDLPKDSVILDLSKSIRSIEGEGDERHVVGDKYLSMCKQAGFPRRLRAPKLYLSSIEWEEVNRHKKWFDGPCVGVILKSMHKSKDWVFTIAAIKKMQRNGWNVFVFAESISSWQKFLLPKGLYYVLGNLKLRDLMKRIAMMDVMMGPDTGPMHIAGALGIAPIVICFEYFTDLFEHYNGAVFASNNFTLENGIRGVAIREVVQAVSDFIDRSSILNVAKKTYKPKPVEEAYIRMRGIGDILLSLVAIATIQSRNGNRDDVKYTYITSPAGKVLLSCTDLFDEVIGVDYTHATHGHPLPPDGIDYSRFTTVNNMINAIDFKRDSDYIPRTELFGNLLHVDQLDYGSNWKIKVPSEWKQSARDLLMEYGVTPDMKTIAFQVDSKGLSRGWPKTRACEFTGLAIKNGFQVILLSDKLHRGYSKHAVNLTGQIGLKEYIGIIAVTDIGLCCDSALIHVAGAMDHQALGLFGAVDPALRIAHYSTVHSIIGESPCVPCNDWQKASCRHKSRWPTCMWNIKPTAVLSKIKSILAGGMT